MDADRAVDAGLWVKRHAQVSNASHHSLKQAVPPAGELIFLATDGLQETHTNDGSMFGVEQALALVRINRHKPSRDIREELNASASRFRQGTPQEDDVTMVVIKSTEC